MNSPPIEALVCFSHDFFPIPDDAFREIPSGVSIERFNPSYNGTTSGADTLHAVYVDRSDLVILVRADYRLVGTKQMYPGHVIIEGAKPGLHEVMYLDPDGKRHPLKQVELP